MEREYNKKDALGKEVKVGSLYGYSTDSSGITTSVLGRVTKFNKRGTVSLEVLKALRGVWMNEPDEIEYHRKVVSVKPMKLFPVGVTNFRTLSI